MPPFKTYIARIEETKKVADSLYIIRLQLPEEPLFSPIPGQYVMIEMEEEGKIKRKAYSIAYWDPTTRIAELCIKQIDGGAMSTFLASLQKEENVTVLGPMGNFFLELPAKQDSVFIATGTGIAPLYYMLHHALKEPIQCTLLYGCKTKEELVYHDWFSKQENLMYYPILSREEWEGRKGHVQDILAEVLKEPDTMNKEYYLCGLIPMVEGVKKQLLEAKVPMHNIHYEKYF